jgi:hypothetical protein
MSEERVDTGQAAHEYVTGSKNFFIWEAEKL